ncbi:MAG: hypothetical protein ABUK01_13795 [Leptospirales bacterium]
MSKVCTRFFRLISIIFIASLSVFCSKTPEELVKLGQDSLANEDPVGAQKYFMQAYEVSLPDEYYFFDRDENYESLTASANGNVLLAIQKNETKKHSTLSLYNTMEDETWTKTVPEIVDNVALSPSGNYMAVSSFVEEGLCSISLWSVTEHEKIPFSATIRCPDSPGISDAGRLFFTYEGKVGVFDISTQKLNRDYLKKTPDLPVKGMPAWSKIQLSPDNVPFMTYGSAGVYKLYSLSGGELKLIFKEATTGKIFFKPSGRVLGVITGGANNHSIAFFTFDGVAAEKYPVRLWKDAAFLHSSKYYFIEGARVYSYNQKKEQELPFFGSHLYTTGAGEIAIFEAPGKVYRFFGKMPDTRTLDNFQLVADIKD